MDERRVRVQGPRSATDADRTPSAGLNNTLNPEVEEASSPRSARRPSHWDRALAPSLDSLLSRARPSTTPVERRLETVSWRRFSIGTRPRPRRGRRSSGSTIRSTSARSRLRSRLEYKSGGFNLTAGMREVGSPRVGVDARGGNQIIAAEPAGASERSGVFHGLHRPAGANPSVQVLDIRNAAAATIRGLELEAEVQPFAVEAGGHLAWTDARA